MNFLHLKKSTSVLGSSVTRRIRCRSPRTSVLAVLTALLLLTHLGAPLLAAETPIQPIATDPAVVAVVGVPGGMGYLIVSAY